MSIPEVAVSFLLENLTQVLQYNYKLVADVRENIQKLQSELMTLKGLMIDFSKYNHDSKYLKQIVNEIRSILCEAEDAVDSYLVQAAIQSNRNGFSKAVHQIDHKKALRDVAKQIEEIGGRVKEMNESRVRNGFEALQHQAIVNPDRGKSSEAPKVEEEHVIGFDGAAEKVEELLTQGAESLEVISIVGMLGLGKTTLAKMVYKDPGVDYEYMIRAFVYVSREYDKRDVLLKILASFAQVEVGDEVNKMDDEQLEKHIKVQLEGKQYLIVLDDVWEPEDWNSFKDAFPSNNKRCRVLITTRNEMAKHANRHNPDALYRLDFLTMEQCQELLRWRVFRKNSCSEELKVYEVKIAEKCDGLPLAVVVIAGILVNHPDRIDWWKSVANSVENYIAKDTEQTGKVIELMYKHLPNYLKPCFLYLGVFREDFDIPVWKLVRLWVSEGLIQQEGNRVLEDMAEQYLEELVYRNLVMVGQRRSNDRIKTCHVHDALREFCKKEALDENLFHEIKNDKLPHFLSGVPSLDQCRRLCINNNVLEYISKTPTRKFVRSFLTFVKEDTPVEAKLVPCIPKAFKLLRVLEIESLIFSSFPRSLCNLVLLKYIAISSNFNNLPSALDTLWNLQTLIVKTSSRTLEIKANIWKMPHFRHLHTNASTSLPSPGTNSETGSEGASPGINVQTLCTISPESCTREIFDRTPTLKKLGIRGALAKLFETSGGYSFLSQLRRLESLENLKLLNDEINNKLYSLPSRSYFPGELTKLTLMNTRLEWREMRTLGELENLEVLKLKDHAFQGNLWNTEKGGFRRLKHLYIGHTDLVVWEASKDHFPKLKSLELNGCDKLKAVPHGLGDIPSLHSMVLHCTNPQVASSARRLQVLKLKQAEKGSKQADKGIKHSDFKLSVYPPDH